MRRPAFATALALASALLALLARPRPAQAFCGFYAGSAGAALYNHATQVVLLRDGLRTVLSMQNDYEGPPDRFAIVIPVPVVLGKDNVRTLSRELFERVDQIDAPRLVEYWEADPCRPSDPYGYEFTDDPLAAGGFGPNDATIRVRPGPVRVHDRFTVGEYEIVILGADDSLGLDAWLRAHGYGIPPGAETALRPYVAAGMKFFVARVDPRRVRFSGNKALLSPLRFHYDAETFALPIRLGLLSSPGEQDLIVHVLARGQRYEVANYDNVAIPTNLDVNQNAKAQLGAFYAALFDRSRQASPGSVVTEYSWDAETCDPCPTPPLDEADLRALGADVAPSLHERPEGIPMGFVLTRLHARYDKRSLGADLVFRAAPPIAGGREVRARAGAPLEPGASPSAQNNFQARYVVRHPWPGSVDCPSPKYGVWGADPQRGAAPPLAAERAGDAPHGAVDLASFLGQPPPDTIALSHRWLLPEALPVPQARSGCAGCRAAGDDDSTPGLAASIALLAAATARASRRRRTRPTSAPR